MRFGMSGCFLPEDMNDITALTCKRVRRAGFSGIATRFRANHPQTTTRTGARHLKALLDGEGIRHFQATGYEQNLIAPDSSERRNAVRIVQHAIRLAGWMGARAVATGPGSMNEEGPWFPHRDNHSEEARERLVLTLRECAKAAEDAGIILALECHQLVTLRTPEIARAVVEAVASPVVRIAYDTANWIDLSSIYDTAAAINAHADTLGDLIASAIAKDVWLENALTLHVQDGYPGFGEVDFAALFRRIEALSPDYPIIAGGTQTRELPIVSRLFHKLAKDLGIRILDSHEEPVAA